MLTYSISFLLELSDKIGNSQPLPHLQKFISEYSLKISEDNKSPLFSKTSTYNNFPVRCQIKKNWRNSNKQSYPKNNPTKINKVSGIKGLSIKVLNKITDNNFDTLSDELLNVLIKNKEEMSVYIVAELILEKIWYDKSFYSLYIKLCKKLWENTEWISECYKIECVEKNNIKEYFYTIHFENKENLKRRSFKTYEKAKKEAEYKCNFKSVFISFCRDNFFKRDIYINEALKVCDSSQKYKLKRKLFGTVEIMGFLFKMNYLEENIIHYIIVSLLYVNKNENGTKYNDEIEALKLLWDIIHSCLEEKTKKEYKVHFDFELKKGWEPRIKFMIEDIINYIDNKSIEKVKQKVENFKDIISKLYILSRKSNENMEKIKDIVNTHNNKQFHVDFVKKLITDSLEYGEYKDSHINTILQYKNIFSAEILSEAFTFAGESISDIKIDAPLAPSNMAYFITNIINNIHGDVSIDLSKIENQDDMEDVEYEWDNIKKKINNSNIERRIHFLK